MKMLISRHSSFSASTNSAFSFSSFSSFFFPFEVKKRSGNMPSRQPMVTPNARPPLAATLEDDISSCSTVKDGGLPQPSLANQYSTYQADLKLETNKNYIVFIHRINAKDAQKVKLHSNAKIDNVSNTPILEKCFATT